MKYILINNLGLVVEFHLKCDLIMGCVAMVNVTEDINRLTLLKFVWLYF